MEVLGIVDVPLTALILVLIASLLYILGKWRLTLFEECGIRGPKPTLFLGNSGPIREKGMVTSISNWAKEYGKVFGIYLGKLPTVVVFDLDILKEVLVKDFQNFTNRQFLRLNRHPMQKAVFFARGKDWRRIRNIMTPTFSGGKLKQLCGRINECAVTLSNNFAVPAEKREIVDVKTFFGAYTMDVISITAFGIVVDSQHDFNSPLVMSAQRLVSTNPRSSFGSIIAGMFPPLAPLVQLVRHTFFPNQNMTFFINTVKEMIKQRRRDISLNKNNHVDFLQLLLNAEAKNYTEGRNEYGDAPNNHKKLSTDEMVAQSLLFLIAGYETTASTLQYVSYCLATHPDCRETLINEIDNELGSEEPNYENISKLKYLECVIKETLRMFPPVFGVNREIAETVTIKGVTLPKGASVYVPIYHIQHAAENYPDPEEFKPERFASKDDVNPLTFLSFGYGPRLCIGMRLALVEAKIALVHVLRKVTFVKLEDTPKKIEFIEVSNLLKPKTPIKLRVEPRKVAS